MALIACGREGSVERRRCNRASIGEPPQWCTCPALTPAEAEDLLFVAFDEWVATLRESELTLAVQKEVLNRAAAELQSLKDQL